MARLAPDNSATRAVNRTAALRVLAVRDVGGASEHAGHDGAQVSDLREANRTRWAPY